MSQKQHVEKRNIKAERFISTDAAYLQINNNFTILDQTSKSTYSVLHNSAPTSNYYALKLDNCDWFRMECAYDALHKKLSHIQYVQCAGFVRMSKTADLREFVIVIEKLNAKPLKEKFKENKLGYSEVMDIFTKIFKILKNLHLNQIYHGSINLDNIYITEEGEIILAEPFSQPCGYAQLYQYETKDRTKILKYCKGGSNGYFDLYALGITAFLLLWNKDETFIENIHEAHYNDLFSYLSSLNPITGTFYSIIRCAISVNHKNYDYVIKNIESILQNNEELYDDIPKTRDIIYKKSRYSVESFTDFLYENWNSIPTILDDVDTRSSLAVSVPSALLNAYKHDIHQLDAYNTCLFAALEDNGTLRLKNCIIYLDSISNLLFSKEHGVQDTIRQVFSSNLFNILSNFLPLDTRLKFLQQNIQTRSFYEISKPWYFQLPNGIYCLTLRQLFEGVEHAENIDSVICDKEVTAYISYKISLDQLPAVNQELARYKKILIPWLILSKARNIEKKPLMPKTYSAFLSLILRIIAKLPKDKFDTHAIIKNIEHKTYNEIGELFTHLGKAIVYHSPQKPERPNESHKGHPTTDQYVASIASCIICSIIILALL